VCQQKTVWCEMAISMTLLSNTLLEGKQQNSFSVCVHFSDDANTLFNRWCYNTPMLSADYATHFSYHQAQTQRIHGCKTIVCMGVCAYSGNKIK